jgi:phospholipase C
MNRVLRRFIVLGPLVAVGCSPNDSGNTSVACQPLTATTASSAPQWQGTVFTIAMENHSRSDILGNHDAPFINSLANRYAVAAGYHDAFVHPSEANYLWMSSGENFGVLDDDDPDAHHLDSTSHIADQAERAGLTWRAYEDGMGDPCGLKSHGRYAAKHDPFVYFNDVNGWNGYAFVPSERCLDHVVDYTELDGDIAAGTVPRYVFITPDLDHDMHDGSIAEGDQWLSTEIPKIMASDAYQKGGVIFLLWDEGSGYPATDDPPFVVISNNAKSGYVSQEDYDTSSYLKTVETLLGVEPLPCMPVERSTITTMDDLFTVAMTASP